MKRIFEIFFLFLSKKIPMQILFRKNIFAENFPHTPLDDVRVREKPRLPFSPFKIVGVILFLFLLFAAIADFNLLAPERAEKLKNLFKKIDEEAEQYALIADTDGFYPCPSCPERKLIWLSKGEVWKYGVSVNGQAGRYSKTFLNENNFAYKTEFVGSLSECYKQEKIKIFMYPNLPENLKRGAEKLFRPPGNPTD
jgi:hypothetical protein